MKQAIKKFLQDSHFFPLVKAIIDLGKLLRYQVHRRFGAVDRQVLNSHLKQHQIRNRISAHGNADFRGKKING
jgi:hypothetical protein